jgi:hypothetical protein
VSGNLTTFIPPNPLNTAVLFMVFNRPDTTKQVFDAIRLAKPPRLYIASDGARISREGEDAIVQSVRNYVKSNIDWECDVKTLFREQNLGCKVAVSSAIFWFFENEEMGIILEDDCLPDPSFFNYCQEMLVRFFYDQRISQINGVDFKVDGPVRADSYHFSKNCYIWGWATWRDRWINYDVEVKSWPQIRDSGALYDWSGDKNEIKYMADLFEKVYQGSIDTWDIQWVFACKLMGQISVSPNVNLISNIGFGPGATHTVGDSVFSNMKLESMQFPLQHPLGVFAAVTLDRKFFEKYVIGSWTFRQKLKFLIHIDFS